MQLIYIGDQFYTKSRSAMSPIYKINKMGALERFDWGFVNIALRDGEEVHIRPANEQEMQWAYSELGKILSRDIE